MMDQRSAQAVASLLPAAQPRFRAFYEAANAYLKPKGMEFRWISGTRSYVEQDAMYAKGRTAPGVPCVHSGKARKIGSCSQHPLGATVTAAKAGFSNHNFSVAGDGGIFKAGKYLEECLEYAELGPIGESCGLKWGGRWKSPDRPHYEFPAGLTLAQMRAKVAANLPILTA